ncbi:MAG TPA: hypothetical protein VMI53_14980 [Opitutaceae bacterium]|nr:hypothetical protein [Opitutaceae bacterium]
MRISLSNLLKNAAPPPRVVLLPDALFFVRAIPVAADALPEDLVSQVELALEAMTPFPLAQLYYGFYCPPGAALALVYAAYRKRLTPEQTAAWGQADLVLPSFVALLEGEPKPGTTLIAALPEALTILHWRDGQVPEKILTHVFGPEAPPEERARVREDLLRAAGESLKIIEVDTAPAAISADDDSEFVFQAGGHEARLPAGLTDQLDIRDKAELALRRRQRMRDLVLWRTFLGCAAALALCLLGEFALVGGRLWQKSRLTIVATRAPAVANIKASSSLVDSINQRLTNRLLPFEMITLTNSCKPPTVQFLRANVTNANLNTLEVEAETHTPTDVDTYKTALTGLPAVASVDVPDQRIREGVSTFTLVVTFKPAAVQPASAIASASP